MLKSLKPLVLVFALSNLAVYAEGGGEAINPTGYEAAEVQSHPMSCEEARQLAYFLRELQRTDGNTNPDLPFVPCVREIVAGSTADAD